MSSSILLLLTLLLTVTMETQALYFAACWGWGPSCSRHEGIRHPVRAARPAQDSSVSAGIPAEESRSPSRSSSGAPRRPTNRGHAGRVIPSIVTSGGWEPGFMGKRNSQPLSRALGLNQREMISLLQLLNVQSKQVGN